MFNRTIRPQFWYKQNQVFKALRKPSRVRASLISKGNDALEGRYHDRKGFFPGSCQMRPYNTAFPTFWAPATSSMEGSCFENQESIVSHAVWILHIHKWGFAHLHSPVPCAGSTAQELGTPVVIDGTQSISNTMGR